MPLLHLILLALIQGVTEFLPISSSGHLALTHHLVSGQNTAQTLLVDIAVHIGTLAAVLLYFSGDIRRAVMRRGDEAHVLFYVVAASIPVVVAGALMHLFPMDWSRSIALIGWTTLLFGILLGVADRVEVKKSGLDKLCWKEAVFIGLAQVLALIPGTSRSGITMTAGRFLGLSRTDSARFSLFLGIIAISGAGVIGGIDVLQLQDAAFSLDVLIAAAIAFIAGLVSIHLMMKWLARASFMPFVIYRILLGLVILAFAYRDLF